MHIEDVQSDLAGAKRQNFPKVLEWTCPECGKSHTKDFREDYITYPEWGESLELPLFCLNCDELEPVTTVTLEPTISLTVVDEQ